MDPLRRYNSGDKMQLDSRFQNLLVDAVRDFTARDNALEQGAISVPRQGEILVKNTSGAPLDRYSVTGVSGLEITPDADLTNFQNQIVFDSASPSSTAVFAIVQEPVPDGGVGAAMIVGVSQVLLDMIDDTHRYAAPISGDYARLMSQAGPGPARILYVKAPLPEEEIDITSITTAVPPYTTERGLRWGVVMFGGAAANSSDGCFSGDATVLPAWWICPPGVTLVRVTVYGGGGAGQYGGGGGGACASSLLTVVPGTHYRYSVANGALGDADPSWFSLTGSIPTSSTEGVLADGGKGGTNISGAGGAGGAASSSYGDIVQSGGKGGDQGANGGAAGGGGGSASLRFAGEDGGNGDDADPSDGSIPLKSGYGGAGTGNGGTTFEYVDEYGYHGDTYDMYPGSIPGGGGAANGLSNIGVGGAGGIRISWQIDEIANEFENGAAGHIGRYDVPIVTSLNGHTGNVSVCAVHPLKVIREAGEANVGTETDGPTVAIAAPIPPSLGGLGFNVVNLGGPGPAVPIWKSFTFDVGGSPKTVYRFVMADLPWDPSSGGLGADTSGAAADQLPLATGSGSYVMAAATTITRYSAPNQDSVTITRGMPVAAHSSGTGVIRASAADDTAPAVGLAQTDVAATFAGNVQTAGHFRIADWTAITGSATLTPRAIYWLDPATPGMITAAQPAAAGQVAQIVGKAIAPDTLALAIGPPILL